MPSLALRCGRDRIGIEYDARRFDVLGRDHSPAVLSDADIGEKLDHPMGSPPMDEIVEPGQTVLIVVPDATRQAGTGQVVNLIVRRLIANGTAPHEISIIFATGIHRKVTEAEKAEILTSFILQRIKTIDHDARDLAQLVKLGETTTGIPVEINRAVVEHDRVIIVGGVTFHYFAGASSYVRGSARLERYPQLTSLPLIVRRKTDVMVSTRLSLTATRCTRHLWNALISLLRVLPSVRSPTGTAAQGIFTAVTGKVHIVPLATPSPPRTALK